MKHYALPYVDSELPPESEPQQSLWIGTCPRCSGDGVIALDLPGADPDDLYTCTLCNGTGNAATELVARRLREAG